MQDIFIGRQAIYDRRLRVYAYELLYREGLTSEAPEMDGDQATSRLLLNAFAEIYAMTAGGPYVSVGGNTYGATRVSGYYLFRIFEGARYGYAAAISYILLIITLIVSTINMKLMISGN